MVIQSRCPPGQKSEPSQCTTHKRPPSPIFRDTLALEHLLPGGMQVTPFWPGKWPGPSPVLARAPSTARTLRSHLFPEGPRGLYLCPWHWLTLETCFLSFLLPLWLSAPERVHFAHPGTPFAAQQVAVPNRWSLREKLPARLGGAMETEPVGVRPGECPSRSSSAGLKLHVNVLD